jgi:hypothetical protein
MSAPTIDGGVSINPFLLIFIKQQVSGVLGLWADGFPKVAEIGPAIVCAPCAGCKN